MKEDCKSMSRQKTVSTEERLRLLDIAALESAEEGIRQGIDDFELGRTLPAKEVFDRIRRKYKIPR